MKAKSIAVVGCGSVGTSFLRQLASRAETRGSTYLGDIYVFDPNPVPGAGAAYQEDTASNLLNTRVASMSPIAEEPADFFRWLRTNRSTLESEFPGLTMDKNSFVPRALFGHYLNEVFAESVQILERLGFSVYHVAECVSSIKKLGDDYELCQTNGIIRRADIVVLSIGNQETTAWDHLRGKAGYFSNPYPCANLVKEIDRRSSICILGSSLSAIDAAVSFHDAGHQGKIIMVSRNGRLPSVRGEQNLSRTPTFLSRDRMQELVLTRAGNVKLKEIAELLAKEIELCDGHLPNLTHIMRAGQGPLKYLDSEISDASVTDRAWQAVLYSTNQSIDLIWHSLSTDEKRVFQTEFLSLWKAYRVSFPVQNARKIQHLLHSDQLTVYAGCKDTFYDEAMGRFATRLFDKSKGFEAILFSDAVINSTGYTTDIALMRAPLLTGMRINGLITPNEFGGIDLDFDTSRVIARSGAVMQGLYALGSLAAGTYFWTNAMNVNTRLASNVAGQVLQSLVEPAAQLQHRDLEPAMEA
jgi:uncharacterized NAD(P)/FAD-binding protein YdhS